MMFNAMSFRQEFQTVDLIIQAGLDISGVDAFSLTLIKAERQIRRLMTNLVYQSSAFSWQNIAELRQALGQSSRVYFEGFENGINAIFPQTVAQLIGEDYAHLRGRIETAIFARNKIFHGQLTPHTYSTSDLLALTADVRRWCELLSSVAQRQIGYDGFERNSFRKNGNDVASRRRVHFADVPAYSTFIKRHVERPRSARAAGRS